MKKHILIYGLCGGVLIVILKLVEYRFLVIQHSIEIYGGLIALLFAVLGIWLGLKLTKNKETVIVREVPAPQFFTLNETRLRELGITRRELEILELIANGAPPPDVRKVSDLPAGNEMSRGYAPENWAQSRMRRVVLGGASPTAHQAAEPRRITHSKE